MPKPRLRAGAESQFQAHGHFRRDRAAAVDDLGDGLAGHAQRLGRTDDGQAQQRNLVERTRTLGQQETR